MIAKTPARKHIEQQVFYTAIGKLPKIRGSYLSVQKNNETGLERKEQKKKMTTVDLEMAKERLSYELKRMQLQAKNKRLKYLLRPKCVTQTAEETVYRKRDQNQAKANHIRAQILRNKREKQQRLHKQHCLSNDQKDFENARTQLLPMPSSTKRQISCTLPEETMRQNLHSKKCRVKFNAFDNAQQMEGQSGRYNQRNMLKSQPSDTINSERQEKRSKRDQQRASIVQQIRAKQLEAHSGQMAVSEFKKWKHFEPSAFKGRTSSHKMEVGPLITEDAL